MNKIKINVPEGIKFLSDWKDFCLPEIPTIINKQICGCGFTEWCIRSPYNIILCSPRKMLLENKESQHEGELYYAKNELDVILNTDKDVNSERPSAKNDNKDEIDSIPKEKIKEILEKLYFDIKEYSIHCAIKNQPCKILVTYDSFKYVRDALGGMFPNFYVVVDEFQSIFTDSKFKSSTELSFLDSLKGFNRLCFVSATPMVDEYLEMMDEFKDLPFIEYDWGALEPGRITKPRLEVFPCKSIFNVAEKEIKNYQEGKFKKKLYRDVSGNVQEIESKELVIYVNSVKNIGEIIKRNGLTVENTNVLCSRTSDNKDKIRKAFGLSKKNAKTPEQILTWNSGGIGKIPKRGASHKMFTLCTRTVYLGADFYSTCARSLILSDANSDCMSVDISLDLPQILGRQRNELNPWKNMADFYYKTSVRTNEELEDFIKKIKDKKKRTENLLQGYSEVSDEVKLDLVENYEFVAKSKNYRDDYISVNNVKDSKVPIFNNLVMLTDIRTYEIQKLDYKDRFCVMSSLSKENEIINIEMNNLINKFGYISQFTDKMKFLCEHPEILEHVPYEYSNYFVALGPVKISALQYKKSLLDSELQKLYSVQDNSDELYNVVRSSFQIGGVYLKSTVKNAFKKIYDDLGVEKTPSSLDIKEYFKVKDVLIPNKDTGKRDAGFKIIE